MPFSITAATRRPVRRPLPMKMMMILRHCICLWQLLLLLPYHPVHAKTKSGSFRLSGVRTERILGAFMVAKHGAVVTISLTTDRVYAVESAVRIRAYRDTEIQQFRREPLCAHKIKLAKHVLPVKFELVGATGGAVGEQQPNKKKAVAAGPSWEAAVVLEIPPLVGGEVERNYYWYFVMDDCSLEEYYHDDSVPTVQYRLSAQNYKSRRRTNKTHLAASDMDMPELYACTFLISAVVWCYLVFRILWKVGVAGHGEVHVAVLWVAGAVACDCWESFFEIAHLHYYYRDGIGSYVADAMSAYFASLSDAMVTVLLLSMAAGWTLGDAHTLSRNVNANPVQRYISSLARPSQSRGLIIAMFAYHLLLAQWGRTYDDDDDSYHHLEHLPGKVLIALRTLCGLVFLGAVRQTKAKFPKLQRFYTIFSYFGCAWFWYLPALALFSSWFLSYHARSAAVQNYASSLQCLSLALLAWLVTTHRTAFHTYSHMAPHEESLTERIASSTATIASAGPTTATMGLGGGSGHGGVPSVWKLGGKVKLRLD